MQDINPYLIVALILGSLRHHAVGHKFNLIIGLIFEFNQTMTSTGQNHKFRKSKWVIG